MTLYSNSLNIEQCVAESDLLVERSCYGTKA